MCIKHLSPVTPPSSHHPFNSARVFLITNSVMSHLKGIINHDTITNKKQRKDCLMTWGGDSATALTIGISNCT